LYIYRPDLGIKGDTNLQTVVLIDGKKEAIIDNGKSPSTLLRGACQWQTHGDSDGDSVCGHRDLEKPFC